MADSENKKNDETIEEIISKQIHPGLLCKYLFLSILIGIIFVWIGSVNKWIAIYAISELCNIFPIDEKKAPYANAYYKAFEKAINKKEVMQGDFIPLDSNVEWQALWKLTPLIILRYMFYIWIRYLWNRLRHGKIYVTAEEWEPKSQTGGGGGIKEIPLGPPVTQECPTKGFGKDEKEEEPLSETPKDGTYFPYNLFKRVCLYNNENPSPSYTCNTAEKLDSIKYIDKNATNPDDKDSIIYRKDDIKNLMRVLIQKWVNGYVIATITSWIVMRKGVTNITSSLNNYYSGGSQYLKFFGINLMKIIGLIGVAGLGGAWGLIKSFFVSIYKTKTLVGPILYSPLLVLNYIIQLLSGIVTFLFFPLFQSHGFKQCWCIFKNNWKSILFVGLLSFALFTGFDSKFGWAWAGSFTALAITGAYILGGIDIKAIKDFFSKSHDDKDSSINCDSKNALDETECQSVITEMNKIIADKDFQKDAKDKTKATGKWAKEVGQGAKAVGQGVSKGVSKGAAAALGRRSRGAVVVPES